jgi:hypothetical protein
LQQTSQSVLRSDAPVHQDLLIVPKLFVLSIKFYELKAFWLRHDIISVPAIITQDSLWKIHGEFENTSRRYQRAFA